MDNSQTGSDQGSVTPIGAISADATSNTQQAAPEPIKLSNDSLIQFDGSDKPVKFSDVRGFQSQFTRVSQEKARIEQALRERDAKLAEYEARQRQAAQGQQTQQPDVYAELEQLPYLTGGEAANMVRSIATQINQRDQFLLAAFKKIQSLEQGFNGLHGQSVNAGHDQKINKWVSDAGYGPESVEIAKTIYAAYEGADLDQEFPRIFSEHMKQVEQLVDARKRAQLEQARRSPFVPGRGGQTGPSAPLKLPPNASAAQIADALWVNRGGSETT